MAKYNGISVYANVVGNGNDNTLYKNNVLGGSAQLEAPSLYRVVPNNTLGDGLGYRNIPNMEF